MLKTGLSCVLSTKVPAPAAGTATILQVDTPSLSLDTASFTLPMKLNPCDVALSHTSASSPASTITLGVTFNTNVSLTSGQLALPPVVNVKVIGPLKSAATLKVGFNNSSSPAAKLPAASGRYVQR